MNKIKLNLGCGSVRPDGWVNTDSSLNAMLQKIPIVGKKVSKLFNPIEYASSNFIYMNLNRPWAFANGSVDVVYASHLFEHLSLKAAELFVSEAFRVLKPGGVVRVVVPDLYQIARQYLDDYHSASDNTDPTKFILWAINMHREGQYGDVGFFKKILLDWQGYPHQHKYMYDSKSLKLKFSRFTEIMLMRYGVSKYIDEIQDVEGTKESYLSVYLEGKKPI